MEIDLSWTKSHPVSEILWVPSEEVVSNNYNPNSVAPVELNLLELSIREHGFTQPIVAYKTEQGYEVVDGFHRHLVGKERLKLTHLPVVLLKNGNSRSERIAATVRHNRARGSHVISKMSSLVLELLDSGKSPEWIEKHLGMDSDEVIRLQQVEGLAALFADKDFSEAWEPK